MLAKGLHPGVILIELLAPGEGAPRDKFMHIGVAGVVTHMLVFKTRPGGRGNNFARLGLHIAEANFFLLFGLG